MNRQLALRSAGILAILTALYHAISGDAILRELEISPTNQMDFVRSTHQLGSMGWLAGGVLLIVAASLDSQQARNWIIGVFAVVYGLPAFGTLALSGGEISIGGVALALVVVLALVGRRGGPMVTEAKTVA